MKLDVQLSVYEKGRKRPEYTLDSDLHGQITLLDLLEWTKQALIITADEVLKEEQAAGFDKRPIVAVDGRVGKPITKVNPLGQIEITARSSVKGVLTEAYDALLYRSKVLTGRYKSSHFVFHNGKQVASDKISLDAWLASSPEIKDNDRVRIVNIQPYARKLERYGITAQRSKTRYEEAGARKKKKTGRLALSPNGTYFLTARAIRAKYKRSAEIKFTYLQGSQIGLSGAFKSGRPGKNSAGRTYLYPTLVITVRERGFTDV